MAQVEAGATFVEWLFVVTGPEPRASPNALFRCGDDRRPMMDDAEQKSDDQKLKDKQLDKALKHSMDASDPPSVTQPGDDGEPHESSGYDAEKEAELEEAATRRNG